MSVFRGTPGPWYAEDRPLATVHGGWYASNETGFPVEANARLMAAAPRLLAFAEAFVERIDEDGEPTPGTRWHAEYVEAKAAIRQATEGEGNE